MSVSLRKDPEAFAARFVSRTGACGHPIAAYKPEGALCCRCEDAQPHAGTHNIRIERITDAGLSIEPEQVRDRERKRAIRPEPQPRQAQPRPHIKPEKYAAIVADIRAGRGIKWIQVMRSADPDTIHRVAEVEGLTVQPATVRKWDRPLTETEATRAHALYGQGLPLSEIANAIKRNVRVVRRHASENGWTRPNIRGKYSRINIRPQRPAKPHMSEATKEALTAMAESGATRREAKVALGITWDALFAATVELGLRWRNESKGKVGD
jgi:hypothetical protein